MPRASRSRAPKPPRSLKPGGLAAWLADLCTRYLRDLSHPANIRAGVATEDDLLAWWPGGASNPKRDTKAWARCYGQYRAWIERRDFLRGDRSSVTGASQRPAIDDAAVMAALADEPQVVALRDGGTVTVYPKSWATLARMRALQAASEWVLDRLALVERHGDAAALAKLPDMVEASTALTRHLVWIATHPGAGLPYAPAAVGADAPTPPAAIDAWHPVDLFAVLQAFHAVNYARMAVLSAYLDGAKADDAADAQRPRWAEFFVGATEPTRETLEALIGDRSVVSVLARVAIAADTQRRAMADAKAKAGQGQPGQPAVPQAREVAPGVYATPAQR